METQSLSTSFDYGFLEPADGKALEKRAQNIDRIQERARRQTAELVVKLGQELIEARSVLSRQGDGVHPEGVFVRWCDDRCGLNRMATSRAIKAAECFGVPQCNKLLQSFDQSALYALSSDSCPEAAFEKALEVAAAGEVVTHKRAKEIIAEFTPAADDDEAEPESQSLALHDLLEHLNQVMEEMESKWPAEFREVLGHKLVAMGECILEMSAKQEVEAA